MTVLLEAMVDPQLCPAPDSSRVDLVSRGDGLIRAAGTGQLCFTLVSPAVDEPCPCIATASVRRLRDVLLQSSGWFSFALDGEQSVEQLLSAHHQWPPAVSLRLALEMPLATLNPLVWGPLLGACCLDLPVRILAVQLREPDDLARLRWIADLLLALRAGPRGFRLISCPTCSRTKTDLAPIVQAVEAGLADLPRPERLIEVAVMGCEVNGPGEAQAADVGAAWAGARAHIFRHGQIIRTVGAEELVTALMTELRLLLTETGDQ